MPLLKERRKLYVMTADKIQHTLTFSYSTMSNYTLPDRFPMIA